jgi:hypothetical protein
MPGGSMQVVVCLIKIRFSDPNLLPETLPIYSLHLHPGFDQFLRPTRAEEGLLIFIN